MSFLVFVATDLRSLITPMVAGLCAEGTKRKRTDIKWNIVPTARSGQAGSRPRAIPIPPSSRSIRASRSTGSSSPAWSASPPAAAGPRGRCISATGAICCGATSPTTASSSGRRRRARSASIRKPSNFANGNTRDRQGRLVTCEHGGRRVTRTEYDGSITVLIDSFDGKRLNSPNDVVVKSDGSIWFTDPDLRHPRPTTRATRPSPRSTPTSTASSPATQQGDRSSPKACSGPTACASRRTRRCSTSSRAAACPTARSWPTT